MRRYLPLAAIAGALALVATAIGAPAQAGPAAGLTARPGSSANVASLVDKAGWRRWRWHRNWWWRWRR